MQDARVDLRPTRSFRPDVEGLRAVAIGLVLLYHAGVPLLPGGFAGVDVFFVLSGFLITTQLTGELDRRGTVSLPRFYARRAKRLLPAAATVLVACAVLVWALLPRTRWAEAGGDLVAAALYVTNWRLADRSVDYLAEDSAPSIVQHFWSLAVEEQFYLVWPLLILLAALVARRLRRRPPVVLWIGLAAIVLPSLAWSVWMTGRSPAEAFFVSTTRLWELGVGAGVALAAGACARMPRVVARVLGWAGLAVVAGSAVLLSTSVPWPGSAALLPTLGTAAVIAAGFTEPVRPLGARPMRWIGGLSYSLYLWHWPLLVAAAAHWGELSVTRGLLVTAVAFVPAWLTARWVENPLRHSPAVSSSSRLALSLGANFTLLGVVAGAVLIVAVDASAPASAGPARGAAVLRADPRGDPAGAPADSVAWMTPPPTRALQDLPDVYARNCQQEQAGAEVIACPYGSPTGGTTVAVVGDSKAAQWMPALDSIGRRNGWRMTTYFKSTCAFAAATLDLTVGKPYTACSTWRDDVLARLLADPPAYVLTSQLRRTARDAAGVLSEDEMLRGLRAIWSRLTAAGTQVVVIADNPAPGTEVYECVAENPGHLTRCAYDRARIGQSASPVQHRAAARQPGVRVVDLTDAICPTDRCAPVIGNVLVYRQGSHLTATYVTTLTDRLATALDDAGL